jgi:hypothetical protein
MKSFKEGTLVMIMFPQQSIVGRFGEHNREDKYFSIKHPRLVTVTQGKNPTPMLKDKLFGNPEEAIFRENDAVVMYEILDRSIETMYLKETTGLTLATKIQ